MMSIHESINQYHRRFGFELYKSYQRNRSNKQVAPPSQLNTQDVNTRTHTQGEKEAPAEEARAKKAACRRFPGPSTAPPLRGTGYGEIARNSRPHTTTLSTPREAMRRSHGSWAPSQSLQHHLPPMQALKYHTRNAWQICCLYTMVVTYGNGLVLLQLTAYNRGHQPRPTSAAKINECTRSTETEQGATHHNRAPDRNTHYMI